jgi:hypothetical protein
MAMHTGVCVVVVVVSVATVSATFGLKRSSNFHEPRSEALEHGFDHMVGSDVKNRAPDLCWQMPVAQMPGKTRQLPGIFMFDLYNELRCRLYFEPSPVIQPQPVSIGHGHGFGQIEENLFSLIRYQTDTPAVTLFEIESHGSRGLVLWPGPGGAMYRRAG